MVKLTTNKRSYGRLVLFMMVQSAMAADLGQQVLFPGKSLPSFTESSCPTACELLSTIRPGQVLYPGTAAYEKMRYNYWDRAQATTNQACVYQPTNAGDVSLGVIVAQHASCPFAVKSGGHGRFSGESSVDGGLGIDLVKLDQIKISEDRETVTLGPGLRWVDVYTSLEPLGITVIGGRDADVGVGGFLLAGGISFLSNEYGWGTENIQSFEVVLANGTITTASAAQNPDLFKVLRGGGANFGIVTAFVLKSVPYKGMWGGMRAQTLEHLDGLLDAFHEYATRSTKKDPHVSVVINTGVYEGNWIFANDLEYGIAVENSPPEIMKPFMDLPAVVDETGIRNMSHLTLSMANLSPRGNYNSYWVLTTKHDPKILRFYIDTFMEESNKLLASGQVAGFSPTGCIQTISPNMRRLARERNGGSIISSLGESDEPLLLFNPAMRFDDPKGAEQVYKLIDKILVATKQKAQELRKDHDYLYLNYASQFQNPVGSYGAESLRLMREASAKYDPKGLFQNLRAGGFKLDKPYDILV
ncbi:FAD binding domain-containing protein [Dactylonectria macrodidyma]|uniref:FAD binding domain-containing protein n=1 Tax=Dactylonectria macrodidyma TaxID=307937 RepID=A0A9P9EHL8_9HYPO|nr:FAD binding domain-containing protein [Dactylonectria macrodidyma]